MSIPESPPARHGPAPKLRPQSGLRAALVRLGTAVALSGALAGCNTVVLNPAGDVARQQGDLVVVATALMLLIVVPVMALVCYFAWRYRAGREAADYDPHWDHSTQLELVIWAAPLLIIICLGAVTWVGTHLLDPYRSVGRIDAGKPVAQGVTPLEVQVVALDWKWLFIYPEQGVATVNELVVPTDRPLQFRITASSVMNSFYVPAMAGQIYAMPGMETRLNAVMNRTGTFTGFSANYSGAGFSNMRFATHAVSQADFAKWAAQAKAGGSAGGSLDRSAYLTLEKPSEKEPVRRYASVDPGLFDAVVDMCVEPGKMCSSEMMAIDMRGGLGKAGIRNVSMLAYDRNGRQAAAAANADPDPAVRRELAWVRALCRQMPGTAPNRTIAAPADLRSLGGAGLTAPQSIGLVSEPPPTPAASAPAAPAHSPQISRN